MLHSPCGQSRRPSQFRRPECQDHQQQDLLSGRRNLSSRSHLQLRHRRQLASPESRTSPRPGRSSPPEPSSETVSHETVSKVGKREEAGPIGPAPSDLDRIIRLRELRPIADSAQAETRDCRDAQCNQQANQASRDTAAVGEPTATRSRVLGISHMRVRHTAPFGVPSTSEEHEHAHHLLRDWGGGGG